MDGSDEDPGRGGSAFTGRGPRVLFFSLLALTILLGVGALIMAVLQNG